jgi:hypothetical protein
MSKFEALFFNINTDMEQYEERDQLYLQQKLDKFLGQYK